MWVALSLAAASTAYADGPLNLEQMAEEMERASGPINGQEELLEIKNRVEGKQEMISGDEFFDYNPVDMKKADPLLSDKEAAVDDGLESEVFENIADTTEHETEKALDAVEDRGVSVFSTKRDRAGPAGEIELRMHGQEPGLGAEVTEATDKFPTTEPGLNTKKFELAPEYYWYKYTERIGVKDEGWKYGIKGTFTHYLSEREPIDSLKDVFGAGMMFNVIKGELRLSYGEVDYEGSGTADDIPDYNVEGRVTAGYDIPLSRGFVITPFAGVGYRYLYNEFSVAPAKVINGQNYASGYDRESKYLYLPIGIETELKMDRGWGLRLTGEFDYLLDGEQVSHLEDMNDLAGNNLGYDKLKNDQRHGIGLRAALKLTKETPRFDFFNEFFIRYWHIEDSEFNFITVQGAYLCEGNLCSGGIEPDNKTWEIGANAGIKF